MLLLLAACGGSADPVTLGRQLAGAPPDAPPPPEAGTAYPVLGPRLQPPVVTPAEERRRLTAGLVADRDNARWTGPPIAPAPAPRQAPAAAGAAPGAGPGIGAPSAAAAASAPPAGPGQPVLPEPTPVPIERLPPVAALPSTPPAPPRLAPAPVITAEPLPPAAPAPSAPAAPSGPAQAALPEAGPPPPPVLAPAPVLPGGPARTSAEPAPAAPSIAPAAPVAPVAPVAPAAPPAPQGSTVSVWFPPGSANLPPSEATSLSLLAGGSRGARFAVIGYGEPRAAEPVALGRARALAVASALRQAGVPAASIATSAEAAAPPGGAGVRLRVLP